MTDRELMQEALYALTYVGDAKEIYSDTIESLRARLAQPEQEPVATLFGSLPVYDVSPKRRKPPTQDLSAPLTVNGVPMYPQREWQGLTDEEILEEYRQSYGDDGNLTDIYFAHAIEAKLKEKNHAI